MASHPVSASGNFRLIAFITINSDRKETDRKVRAGPDTDLNAKVFTLPPSDSFPLLVAEEQLRYCSLNLTVL